MNDKIKQLLENAEQSDAIAKNKWRIENREQLRKERKEKLKELMEKDKQQVVYEIDFGEEAHGEVRLINGLYRCFVTPQYGGDWQEIGTGYQNIEKAIEHIKSHT
jgi:hypothetical protein